MAQVEILSVHVGLGPSSMHDFSIKRDRVELFSARVPPIEIQSKQYR